MLGTAQNLSTRTLAKGLLCAATFVAALLLALAAGASASAAEPVIPAASGSTPETAPESTTTPSSTPEPPTAEATPPPVEVPPVEVPPPPVVLTPEAPPAPEVDPPPTGVKELVPAEATSKPVEGTPNGDQTTTATVGEGPASTAPSSSGQIAAALISTPPETPQNAALPDGATAEASSVLLGRLAVGSAGRSSGPPSGPGAGAIAGSVSVAGLSAAQRAAELSCQLSGMAGTANDDCGASWLGAQVSLSVQAVGFRAPTGSRTGPPDGGYGDSVGGSHPVVPAPAPAPSGAVGGSAGGGSGVSPAGFFTLAGLLLLAAPRALRRLRLSCQPWRTAFFVLIPERPG